MDGLGSHRAIQRMSVTGVLEKTNQWWRKSVAPSVYLSIPCRVKGDPWEIMGMPTLVDSFKMLVLKES